MSQNDDLLKAFGAFTSGMREFAVSKGINDATAEVDALKQMQISDMDMRAQQQQIAQRLALQLTGAGAKHEQVATAMGALAPEQIRNSQDAMALAARKPGDGSIGKYGEALYAAERKPKEDDVNLDYGKRSELAKEQFGYNKQLTQMQIDAGKFDKKGAGGKPLTSVDTKKIGDLDTAISSAEDLLSRYKLDPKLEGAVGVMNRIPGREWFKGLTDSDFADFKAQVGRDFDLYRQAITGAGASTGELKMLMKNRPTMEDTPDAFQKKFETIIRLAHKQKASFISTQGKAGRDVSGFEEDLAVSKEKGRLKVGDEGLQQEMQAATQPPQGVPAGARPQTRMNRSTKQMEVIWVTPDGKAFAAD